MLIDKLNQAVNLMRSSNIPVIVITYGKMEAVGLEKFVHFLAETQCIISPMRAWQINTDFVSDLESDQTPVYTLAGNRDLWSSDFWKELIELADLVISLNEICHADVVKFKLKNGQVANPLYKGIEECIQDFIQKSK